MAMSHPLLKAEATVATKTAREGLDENGFWSGENGASGILPIARDTKRICLAWRSIEVQTGECWGTIGGACKDGMSPADSAKAEMAEETGYHGSVELHPAYVFTSGSFTYRNFIGVVDSEFGFSPGEDHGWETDFIEWKTLAEIQEELKSEPGNFHPGMISLFKQSSELITKLITSKQAAAPATMLPDSTSSATGIFLPDIPTWEQYIASEENGNERNAVLNCAEQQEDMHDWPDEDEDEDGDGEAVDNRTYDQQRIDVIAQFDDCIKHLRSLTYPLELWRAVRLKSIKDLRTGDIGTSWSWSPRGAKPVYNGPNGGEGTTFQLYGRVQKAAIDWGTTIAWMLTRYSGDEEEIRLKTGAQVELLGIEKNGVPVKMKPKMVTATAHTATTPALTFENDVTDSYRGETFANVYARNAEGKVIGKIDYSIYDGEIHIKMVEVEKASQRQGIGAQLMNKLRAANPGLPIDWGMLTDEGSAFKTKVYQDSDTPPNRLLQELEALRPEMAKDAQHTYDEWPLPEYGDNGLGTFLTGELQYLIRSQTSGYANDSIQNGDYVLDVESTRGEHVQVILPSTVFEERNGDLWRVKPDVTFKAEDFIIKLPDNPSSKTSATFDSDFDRAQLLAEEFSERGLTIVLRETYSAIRIQTIKPTPEATDPDLGKKFIEALTAYAESVDKKIYISPRATFGETASGGVGTMQRVASPDMGYSQFNDRETDLNSLDLRIVGGFRADGSNFHACAFAPDTFDEGGQNYEDAVGYVDCWRNKDTFLVDESSINDDWRGTGLGQRLYDLAIAEAKRRGAKEFRSGSVLSNDAERAWARLAKRYPVTELPGKEEGTDKIFSIDLTKANVKVRLAFLHGATPELQAIVSKYESKGLMFSLSEQPHALTLSEIRVPKENQKQGLGSAFMQDLAAYADLLKKPIFLTPSKDYGASSVGRLREFYGRFGFKMNKGRNKDFSSRESMVRQPKRAKLLTAGDGTITENPKFMAWFSGSKITDEHGQPMRMYHGTKESFAEFDESKFGISDEGWMGKGFYFTYNPEEASGYALGEMFGKGASPNVMPVYLSIKNPLVFTMSKLPDGRTLRDLHDGTIITDKGSKAVRSLADTGGHDGIVLANNAGNPLHVVAFRADQIKSAIGNSGEFSTTDRSIIASSTEEWKKLPENTSEEKTLKAILLTAAPTIYRDTMGKPYPEATIFGPLRGPDGKPYPGEHFQLQTRSDAPKLRWPIDSNTLESIQAEMRAKGWIATAKKDGSGNPALALIHKATRAAQKLEEKSKDKWLAVATRVEETGTPCYVRFGEIPPSGVSHNYQDDVPEPGVSVIHAKRGEGVCVVMPNTVTLAGTVSRITSSRHLYLVEGREVGTGSDGEPCLADATAERLQDRVFIKNLQDDSLKVAGIGKNPPGKPETVYPERSNGWALNPDQRGENVAPSLAQLLPEELKPSS